MTPSCSSMDASLLILAIMLTAAAAFVAVWSPGRDGQQLRVVRRLTQRVDSTRDELGGRWPSMTMVACGPRLVIGRQDRPVDHP